MKKILLHLDHDPQPSAFDQIAAYDSGVDRVIAYGGITPGNVQTQVYGAMFTRGPEDLKNTAIFIGGSDVAMAEEIFERVQQTFFGPMRVSVMFDANGSNTTAAAAVAKIVSVVKDPAGKKAVVLAGTGPVGIRAAILLAGEGCQTYISSRQLLRSQEVCNRVQARFGAGLLPLQVDDDSSCQRALDGAAIVLCAGKLGVELVKKEIWSNCPSLEVLADVNAVAPAGAEGIKATDNGKVREGKTVFGAIGIGNTKMKVQRAAVASLFESNDRVLDFQETYRIALRFCQPQHAQEQRVPGTP
jgi:threonine dehydrogenase-like Zn-dependent dehydrogenase